MIRALAPVFALALVVVAAQPAAAQGYDYRSLHLLEDRHTHLILRLSDPPEGGDPPERGRAECNDVNGLDRRGRNLANAFGRALNRSSIGFSDIYTSRICRNVEAAEILHMGPVKVRAELDPLPEDDAERRRQIDSVYALIEDARAGDTVLLLTHPGVIEALTGETLDVGEGLVFRLPPFGEVEVRARLGLPPL